MSMLFQFNKTVFMGDPLYHTSNGNEPIAARVELSAKDAEYFQPILGSFEDKHSLSRKIQALEGYAYVDILKEKTLGHMINKRNIPLDEIVYGKSLWTSANFEPLELLPLITYAVWSSEVLQHSYPEKAETYKFTAMQCRALIRKMSQVNDLGPLIEQLEYLAMGEYISLVFDNGYFLGIEKDGYTHE